MNAETFFNNGFGEDCEKVHKNHVIQLMQNFAEHYHSEQLRIAIVSNSCLICGKELDKETAEHGNGTCSEYCNAKYSGYPMPSDYSEGLQKLVDNCC